MFSYTTNVNVRAGITLKKIQNYSKTNNERVHIEYGLWISSTAFRSWISETQEKKKKENRKNLH